MLSHKVNWLVWFLWLERKHWKMRWGGRTSEAFESLQSLIPLMRSVRLIFINGHNYLCLELSQVIPNKKLNDTRDCMLSSSPERQKQQGPTEPRWHAVCACRGVPRSAQTLTRLTQQLLLVLPPEPQLHWVLLKLACTASHTLRHLTSVVICRLFSCH